MSKKVRRICIYGGPGSGKSTLGPKIFSHYKSKGLSIEYVGEFIKDWAYEGRKPVSMDQMHFFTKQNVAEDRKLRYVDLVVCESPLLLNAAYAFKDNESKGYAHHLIELAKYFDNRFPPLDLLIQRTVPYKPEGRYQTYEQALEFDDYLSSFLETHARGNVSGIDVLKFDYIIALIDKEIA